jgi:hypothetical protein
MKAATKKKKKQTREAENDEIIDKYFFKIL